MSPNEAALKLLVLLLAVFAVALYIQLAHAHDAPLGWKYDASCCSGVDCRQIKTKRVKVTAQGYEIQNGRASELITYSDRRIHESKDEYYHLCTKYGQEGTKILCLYVPNAGF